MVPKYPWILRQILIARPGLLLFRYFWRSDMELFNMGVSEGPEVPNQKQIGL